MLGPGKYDQDATELRKKYKADGIILVVMNGSKGNGFSVQIRIRPPGEGGYPWSFEADSSRGEK